MLARLMEIEFQVEGLGSEFQDSGSMRIALCARSLHQYPHLSFKALISRVQTEAQTAQH